MSFQNVLQNKQHDVRYPARNFVKSNRFLMLQVFETQVSQWYGIQRIKLVKQGFGICVLPK